ncbi:hypothetical protein SKAU_G00180140 [Synaphobranchus kaupii]|uniref:Uncharacterized protein n=1 Tax=Synaphobranchus kaupii TaxID=118154 RepID=A0A9Q1FM50_SYNKA|nr:hypothetical protein SKAU_G00180140 [Synaphobranchus kaupii]
MYPSILCTLLLLPKAFFLFFVNSVPRFCVHSHSFTLTSKDLPLVLSQSITDGLRFFVIHIAFISLFLLNVWLCGLLTGWGGCGAGCGVGVRLPVSPVFTRRAGPASREREVFCQVSN